MTTHHCSLYCNLAPRLCKSPPLYHTFINFALLTTTPLGLLSTYGWLLHSPATQLSLLEWLCFDQSIAPYGMYDHNSLVNYKFYHRPLSLTLLDLTEIVVLLLSTRWLLSSTIIFPCPIHPWHWFSDGYRLLRHLCASSLTQPIKVGLPTTLGYYFGC